MPRTPALSRTILALACAAAFACATDDSSPGSLPTFDDPEAEVNGASLTPGDTAEPSGESAPDGDTDADQNVAAGASSEDPTDPVGRAPSEDMGTTPADERAPDDPAAADDDDGAPVDPDTLTGDPEPPGQPSDEPPDAVGDGPVFALGSRPRVMIVGDSIAAGPGCFKGFLRDDLVENGYSSFDFVGEYTDDCGAGVMHSALSCSTAAQYVQASFSMPNCRQGEVFSGLAPLVARHQPDLILLQLGVNDVWNGRATNAILADYSELLRQARAENPDIVMVVAQIHKIRPDCNAAGDAVLARAEALINEVPGWVQGQSTARSPVFVADLWTNSDPAQSIGDCVHPDQAGAERMGRNWFNALRDILNPD